MCCLPVKFYGVATEADRTELNDDLSTALVLLIWGNESCCGTSMLCGLIRWRLFLACHGLSSVCFETDELCFTGFFSGLESLNRETIFFM